MWLSLGEGEMKECQTGKVREEYWLQTTHPTLVNARGKLKCSAVSEFLQVCPSLKKKNQFEHPIQHPLSKNPFLNATSGSVTEIELFFFRKWHEIQVQETRQGSKQT